VLNIFLAFEFEKNGLGFFWGIEIKPTQSKIQPRRSALQTFSGSFIISKTVAVISFIVRRFAAGFLQS
jgi:hypothetical protein